MREALRGYSEDDLSDMRAEEDSEDDLSGMRAEYALRR